jgi:hypothetical protein
VPSKWTITLSGFMQARSGSCFPSPVSRTRQQEEVKGYAWQCLGRETLVLMGSCVVVVNRVSSNILGLVG